MRCALALTLLATQAVASDGVSSPARLAAMAEPASAVVLIRQGTTTCAGAFVAEDGTVVTAYHCVADGGRARVETRDGRRAVARVIARLPSHDLALLAVPGLAGEPWLALRDDPIPVGAAVHAWGHPFGNTAPGGFLAGMLRWSVTEGTVAASGPRALHITAAVNPGNSGGPVVDDDGALVGVVSRRLRGEGLGFAARSEAVRLLLEDPTRGSVLGGSVRAEVFGSSFEGDGGTIAAGARVELGVRDCLVVAGSFARAPQPVLDALRFGRASWVSTELVVGPRQRVGHGYMTTRLDAYGGVALVSAVDTIGDRSELRTGPSSTFAPIFGGRVSVATVTLDLAGIVTPGEAPALRASLGLRWPGRLGVW